MNQCIYCNKSKEDNEFSLEHVIPQFLGGAYAPDFIKTRDVCAQCNNILGLFVDGSFEKNWLVNSRLRQVESSFFDPENPVGFPLKCMGPPDLSPSPPNIPTGFVCEHWVGQLGESVFWIRPHEDNFFSYVGGNPIATRKTESRAYFLFSINSEKNPLITWYSFKNAFSGRKVKKIMCTTVDGADPKDIGFSDADELDTQRITYFQSIVGRGQSLQYGYSMKTHFDMRFLAKMAIGISYCLFGSRILNTCYGKELNRVLMSKDNLDFSGILATPLFANDSDDDFKKLMGYPNAVTIAILPTPAGIGLNLNIGTHLHGTILCVPASDLIDADLEIIKDGFIILLFRALQTAIKVTLTEFSAHQAGVRLIPKLVEIDSLADKHSTYFKALFKDQLIDGDMGSL